MLYIFLVIRAFVPKLNLDDTFEQKNEIAKAVEEELEKAKLLTKYIAAARLRMAATEKAEAEKILQIKRAEGEAESKYLSGLGIARQRQAIVDETIQH
ncbi:hypothetical protein Hdeb2414_s0016g00488091 [Helianthus debilis subsp. tardiflorus]